MVPYGKRSTRDISDIVSARQRDTVARVETSVFTGRLPLEAFAFLRRGPDVFARFTELMSVVSWHSTVKWNLSGWRGRHVGCAHDECFVIVGAPLPHVSLTSVAYVTSAAVSGGGGRRGGETSGGGVNRPGRQQCVYGPKGAAS